MISSLSDGSNLNPDAPQDGSCSIFHSNGGGISRSCGGTAPPANQLLNLQIGEVYGDLIYAGSLGGKRLYTKLTDQGLHTWNNGVNGYASGVPTGSATDGKTNTDVILSTPGGTSPYMAAETCRALGPEWYLPAYDELVVLFDSQSIGAFNGTYQSTEYWASNMAHTQRAYGYFFMGSYGGQAPLIHSLNRVRCVRTD
jgi:hypothetical protein